MKTRRIRLTLAVPDLGHLLRVSRHKSARAVTLGRQLRLPGVHRLRRTGSMPQAVAVPIIDSPVLEGGDTAAGPTLARLSPLEKAGFRGRTLAIVLSPATVDDFIAAGQFGRLRRMLDRYTRSFDAVYLFSPDASNFTNRIGVPKARHFSMPRWIPARRYLSLFLIPSFHRAALANVTVVRIFNPAAGITGALIRRRSGARVVGSTEFFSAEFEPISFIGARRISRFLDRRGLDAIDELVAFSPVQQELLSDSLPGRPVRLLPALVDTGVFCPTLDTDPAGPPFILFTGRLEDRKNIPLIFDAVEIATRAVPGLRLAVIGDGPLRFRLEQEARARELNVEFEGAVEHESLPSLFSRALAYVRSAVEDEVPVSLLEAMSAGTPGIVPDLPGGRDVIVNGVSGFVINPDNPKAIADAVVRLHREPRLRSRLGVEARRAVTARYSIEAALNKEVDILLGRSEFTASTTPTTFGSGPREAAA